MQYPKPVMRMKELKEMGFSEEWLRFVFWNQGTKAIAWKSGMKDNSPILFDTEALEKYRKASCVGR